MRAAVLRYRVMAYITGVVLIILCFVGIPLQVIDGNTVVVNDVGTLHGILYIIYIIVAYLLTRRLAAGHRPDRAGPAGRHHPGAHLRGGALAQPPVHRPGAGRGGPAGRTRAGRHAPLAAAPVGPG